MDSRGVGVGVRKGERARMREVYSLYGSVRAGESGTNSGMESGSTSADVSVARPRR